MTKTNNNISLHKVWLIIIIVACIGSPFLAFATLRGGVQTNTDNVIMNREDIKDIEGMINDPKYGIAALNGKMDVLIGLVGKIESNIEANNERNTGTSRKP